jgi:formate-dependent nitrite reductase cytochrome c552 subunit
MKELHVEWSNSIHSRMGVTCEKCHGGNPKVSRKEEAHQGVYDSMDPKSTVYYTNIPRLCGSCHKHEFNEFKMSVHYKMLMTKGIGPNCVTCHDAMSTKMLQPDQVELFCGMCHNAKMSRQPDVVGKAQKVLEKMASTTKRMAQVEATLRNVGPNSSDARKADGLLNRANHELSACKQDWHAFELDRINKRLDGVAILINQGVASLRSSGQGEE